MREVGFWDEDQFLGTKEKETATTVNTKAEIIEKTKPKVNTTKDKGSSPRYVILDTETTGISHREHKIIEIGCVEIINNKLTGREYVQRINPSEILMLERLEFTILALRNCATALCFLR